MAERDGGGSESQECVQGKRYEREMNLKTTEIQQVSMSTSSVKAADAAWNGGVRVVEL